MIAHCYNFLFVCACNFVSIHTMYIHVNVYIGGEAGYARGRFYHELSEIAPAQYYVSMLVEGITYSKSCVCACAYDYWVGLACKTTTLAQNCLYNQCINQA